jgi:hypothetical protein
VKAGLISVMVFLGAAALLQPACTKPSNAEPKAEQSKAERIREVDAQLANWVPTGRPEDAQKRGALQSERAVLAADLGYSTSTVTRPVTVAAATPYQSTPTGGSASDSKRTENRWQPMGGDSSWMDTTKQTHVHGGTVGGYYGQGYSRDSKGRVIQTNPSP